MAKAIGRHSVNLASLMKSASGKVYHHNAFRSAALTLSPTPGGKLMAAEGA